MILGNRPLPRGQTPRCKTVSAEPGEGLMQWCWTAERVRVHALGSRRLTSYSVFGGGEKSGCSGRCTRREWSCTSQMQTDSHVACVCGTRGQDHGVAGAQVRCRSLARGGP